MTEIERGKARPDDDCYRILVLDDNSEQMEEIKVACLAVGQELVAVNSIREGIEFLERKDHVDVIVAEAFMQNESVFELLKQLKGLPDHQDVPVMIMSVDPGEIGLFCNHMVKQTAQLFGAYKFLIMPKFDVKKLMREVDALLPHEKQPKREKDPEGAY
jgi:CheY-like chemotaxis protein